MNAPRALVLDLLEWIDVGSRSYADVMQTWRTSCPCLPVWEDAVDLGLVRRERNGCGEPSVVLTGAGRDLLRAGRARA